MSSDDDEKIRPYNPDDDDDDNDDEKIRPANSDSDDEKENVFNLFIKDVNLNQIQINCSPSDTISQLKEKIYEIKNIKPNNQRLNFESQELSDNNKTIKDYKIPNNSTLHLTMRLTGGLFYINKNFLKCFY